MDKKMQVLFYSNDSISYKNDYPIPTVKANESLVKVSMAAICNTDREVLKGYKPNFSGVLGHEFVGVVVKTSDNSLLDKKVVAELNLGCKKCVYCRTNREKHCKNRKVIGLEKIDGAFAEYILLDNSLIHTIPNSLQDSIAIYVEPLAAALEIIDSVHIKPSMKVAVVGDGRLSFMISQIVALNGCNVTVFGLTEEKLKKFSSFSDVAIYDDTYKEGFDVVVEATGSPSGIDTAINLVYSKGTIVVKSTYAQKANIDLSQIVVREIKLVGSRCGPFAPAIKLLSEKKIIVSEIELYPLSEHEKAFDSRAFKVGFSIG